MTKKDLVALADARRVHNQIADGRTKFTPDRLLVLANFCARKFQSSTAKRWIDCIAGEGGQGDIIAVEADNTVILGSLLEGTGLQCESRIRFFN